jgi:predicted AAA+ superfamily ATPase
MTDQYIPRTLADLGSIMRPGKALVIYGPRQVGKTSLAERYLAQSAGRILRATGDDVIIRTLIGSQNAAQILSWVEGYDILFLDEAQRVPEVGWGLKILTDSRPDLRIIVTGSSSFALSGTLGEPLTGRQTPLQLFPISIGELSQLHNRYELKNSLDDMLRYGMYPEVRTATTENEKRATIRELTSSYLLKDILELERIKSSKTLIDLLTLIALQIGAQVSTTELASTLGIDAKTVTRYLDLFEKSFILYNLRGLSRNLRSEVTKMGKYYFYDTGVRNAIINNFNPLSSRDDTGALWENFMFIERLKALTYAGLDGPCYFWRTWEQQEIDLVEDRDGQLHAYEFKWNPNSKPKVPPQFARAYPEATFETITPNNFLENLSAVSRRNA